MKRAWEALAPPAAELFRIERLREDTDPGDILVLEALARDSFEGSGFSSDSSR